MDHLPHGLPQKRKAEHDDTPATVSRLIRPTNPKRPRLVCSNLTQKHPRPPPIARVGSDAEGIGIIPNVAPGPLTDSLLDVKRRSPPAVVNEEFPVDFDAALTLVPSMYPYISRQTLKELDLEVILRNPQLRHDLLFDYGLQFRPTYSRRKRQFADAYWNAVTREIESGCTCFSLDRRGNPLSAPACICTHIPHPPASPVVCYTSRVVTIRMPSRIRPLLTEFLEVLLLVIQPLQSIYAMYVNPDSFRSQMAEHSTQAKYIRSIFDPALIEQELKHDAFDLSSLLRVIGTTLKGHCAPMRDQAVEAMVTAAEACKPGGNASKTDAVNAFRACLDILELMKLDIANHQVQSVRMNIARSSGQYELSAFKTASTGCPPITQQWITQSLSSLQSKYIMIAHPLYQSDIKFPSLLRNRQIYLAALKGLTDIVFNPPFMRPAIVVASDAPLRSPFTVCRLVDYPETLRLDHARLRNLTRDLGDIVVTYMFLLLFRQLLYSSDWSEPPSSPHGAKVDSTDMMKLKNEIQAIGVSRLGSGFSQSNEKAAESMKDTAKWTMLKDDIVMHVARRAQEKRCMSDAPTSSSSPPSDSLPLGPLPSERLMNVAKRWALENINLTSPLCQVLYDRLHTVVFNGVVAQSYPGRGHTIGQLFFSAIELNAAPRQGCFTFPIQLGSLVSSSPHQGLSSGMEPLIDEIQALVDKISRLSLIHLNTYLPLYEAEGFLKR
ncbi:Tcp11-domain-containing protein [Dendrothele bispora CBS 962.96]|uniref:Tcp11-domain-containing protein n=1 Tax=Dendrothele bispora (strain CBS 962.96) TaxID=1314807 RepID=A0A4S8MRR2_DENBC|nr:Tcp11-domain-containing protein [Dendrothele bispora CBS 962.96]